MAELTYKKLENKIRQYLLKLDYFLTYKLFKYFLNKELNKKEVKNILVIETTLIGDVINTTPVFEVLRKNFENSKITILCLNKSKDIILNNPCVNEVITLNKEINLFNLSEFKYLEEKVRSKRFQLAIILHHGSLALSLLLLFAGVSYRIGCTRTGILKGKGFFLNKKKYPDNKIKHIVEQNLDVLRLLPIQINEEDKKVKIFCTKEEELSIINKFNLKKDKKYFGVHIGTQHKSQRWQIEKWIEIIDNLTMQKNVFVILTGTQDNLNEINNLVPQIKNKDKIIIAAGKTNLRELFALVKKLDLLVSIDTSIVHIAAAFNIPTITLYGPGHPEKWHPWQKKSKWIIKDEVCTRCRCHSCIWTYLNKERELECMRNINSKEVIEMIDEVKK